VCPTIRSVCSQILDEQIGESCLTVYLLLRPAQRLWSADFRRNGAWVMEGFAPARPVTWVHGPQARGVAPSHVVCEARP
jgi:hypothetical protein